MAALETGDGRKLPRHLAAELNRLRRRLVLVRDLICELDTERDEQLAATSGDAITTEVTTLSGIYGIGDNFAAVLAREVFYRHFGNRHCQSKCTNWRSGRYGVEALDATPP